MRAFSIALTQGRTSIVARFLRAELENVVKRALGDDEPTVHVELAEIEGRVDQQLPFGRPIDQPRAELGPRAVAEPVPNAVRRLQLQIARPNQLAEQRRKRPDHSLDTPFSSQRTLPDRRVPLDYLS